MWDWIIMSGHNLKIAIFEHWGLNTASAARPPRRNSGLWCVSTRRDQHKAQKEMWLVSGL